MTPLLTRADDPPGILSVHATDGGFHIKAGILELERPYFAAKTNGATVSCSTPYGDNGPTHFDPGWLFRDTITDHGQFSSTSAVIVVPSKLLPRGSVAVTFPYEVGKRMSPFAGNLHWSNVGHLSVRAT